MSRVKIYIAKNEKMGSDIIWQRQTGKNILKNGLREWIDDDKFVPNIKKDANGKAYLVNSDLHFNISHSMSYVICAIGETEVGIDIQFHKKNDNDKVARKIMSAKEWQEYQDSSDKAKFFFDTWAIKESFLKYTGEGLRRDLRLLDIDAYVQEIAIDENYSCMLCVGAKCKCELVTIVLG